MWQITFQVGNSEKGLYEFKDDSPYSAAPTYYLQFPPKQRLMKDMVPPAALAPIKPHHQFT